MTNAYSSEFGRSSGGIINAITRSGQNQIHGNLFEYLRNSALDAKNYFDPADRPIPPFKRNQFGGTLGGPVRRDKTFFFGAFEALRDRLGFTGVTNVPDDNARKGILPDPSKLGQTITVPVNSASAQLLTLLFPTAPPNAHNNGNGTAQYQFTAPQPTNEYFAQGRIDHRFSEKDSFFGRYTFDNGNVNRQVNNKTPADFTKERSRNQYLTLEHQHFFSQLLLNTLRVSYSRSTSEADNQRTVDVPSQLWFVPGTQFGFFTIQGVVSEEGGDYRLPRNDHLNNYQWHDALFWTKRGHGFRFGTEGQRLQFNQHTTSQYGGIETFNSLSDFLQGKPSQLNFAVPGRIDPDRGYRESVLAFFIQDDYRWKPNFTLNLGLRYEFATVPTEAHGKISNLRQVSDSQLTIGSPWHSNPSLRDFAPRVGLAWDPFKNGKTSVRAGFGIFDDQILPKYYVFSGSLNPPFTTRTSRLNPPFPNGLQGFDVNQPICSSTSTPPCFKANLQTVNFDLQPAYIMQYNLSVQRALPGNWDITIGYAGSHGLHLIEIAESNLAPTVIVNGVQQYCPGSGIKGVPPNMNCDPKQNGRRNANFGGIDQRKSDAQSFYNALQVGAVKRFSHGLRAQFSYTFSRSIDDASGINSQDFDNSTQYATDFYNRQADRGLSSFWSQHVFVANWGYELPFGGTKKGLSGALLKGWELNGINTVQSGTPFEPRLGFDRSGNMNTIDFSMHERPSLAPGASNNPVTGDPAHWFDAYAFVLPALYTRGNVGRNTIIGPKLVDFDFSLIKQFTLGEQRRLDFRTEMFNIFNHPNFGVPNQANRTILFPPTVTGSTSPSLAGTPPTSLAGAITTTVTTSRQIQFGLKFTF